MTIESPPSFAELLSNRHPDPLLTREFSRHWTSGAEWLEALPRLLRKAFNHWELTVDDADPGYIRTGNTAVVIDVLKGKKPAVLKLSWSFMEGAFEHLALREWDGVGAVRLEAAEPRDYALLLERLDHRRSLAGELILDACEVIGTLINTLNRPASPKFQTIAGALKAMGGGVRRRAFSGAEKAPHPGKLSPERPCCGPQGWNEIYPHRTARHECLLLFWRQVTGTGLPLILKRFRENPPSPSHPWCGTERRKRLTPAMRATTCACEPTSFRTSPGSTKNACGHGRLCASFRTRCGMRMRMTRMD